MPPIRKSIASLCVLVLTACAGEPFRAVAEEHDAGPGPATIPADPAIGPPVSSVAPSPKKRAYARSGPSQVAAFDPATGHVLSTTVVGEVVGDLVLDGSRLLAATSPNDLETSRVRAFDIVDGQLSLVGESDELGPGARLFPFPPYVLVLTEDMAVTWSLLDSALRLVPGSQAINRPSSLVSASVPGRLLSLSSTGFDAGETFDSLLVARFDSQWQIDFHSIPAPGRPSSRLAGAEDRDEAYLVRKHEDGSQIEIAEISRVDPAVPTSFRSVTVPGAKGSIECVEVAADRDALVLLLSRGSSTGALVLLPLRLDAEPSMVPLSGPVESSPWFCRSLALSPSGRVLAATTQSIEAFDLGGSGAAPELIRDADFAGGGFAAPLITVE